MWANASARLSKGCGRSAVHSPWTVHSPPLGIRGNNSDQVLAALTVASSDPFRIVHFSVQSDHIHLIVEAHDKDTLGRGLLGLTIRLARAINRPLSRSGAVWGDRYHARALASRREVRNTIVYVLMNFRKHRPADGRRLDPYSTAPWFDGFREPVPRVIEPPPSAAARTWLLRVGWRRRGLIGLDEAPQSDG